MAEFVIPIEKLREWLAVIDRYTVSDADGESYNNYDAIAVAKEMRDLIDCNVKDVKLDGAIFGLLNLRLSRDV